MSLLVLRAMLFASSTLLFDMEAETAHLPLAQAALMLMNWVPESPATTSPVPYRTWLSLAIHHAKLVNAHRHAGICDVGTTANEPRSITLRRLWWCCIICDRLLSLTCRFRLQITPDMLDMENCVPLGFADLQSEIHRSNVFSPATKRQLISLFSKYLGLLMLLTELIPVAYPFETRLESSPDFSVQEEENIRKSCDLLGEWYDTAKAQFPPFHQLKAAEESDSVNSIAVHTNLMYIYYQVFPQISGIGSPDFHRGDYEDGDRSNEIRGDIEDSVLGLSYEGEVVPSHLKGWPLFGLDPMHKHLQVVVDAADTFSAQYYGSQWVKEAAEHVAKLAKSFNKLSLQSGQEAMKDWVDILVRYPETYLGLVWTVDMCVSRRKLPEAQDFPLCLRNDVERLNAAPRESEHENLDSRSLDGQKDLQLTQSLDYLLGIQEPMVDVI
uniref:Xylanolytic transcriptional activator regulatory domain-containing protein n=1 Tax=Fusarium oxysporum (strain Fo5176) TaxID=660025 RepID=A0A0D2XLB9_FUSOF